MQHDADKVHHDNRDSTTNPSPTRTDNVNQLSLRPPPYTQYPQQSLSDIRCMTLETQNCEQTPSCQQDDALVLPARTLSPHADGIVVITPKIRAFFIISGIAFLLLGAGAIGLETSIMMYSFSTYYRGVWSGNMMLATSISMLVAAGRRYHSIIYTTQLLAFTMITVLCGIVLSTIELSTMRPCVDESLTNLCDTPTGKILKLTIVGELNLSLVCTMTIFTYAQRIKSKSENTPPSPRH